MITRHPIRTIAARALVGAVYVVSCLGSTATLSQVTLRAIADRLTVTVTVEGIRPLEDSYILVSLAPTGEEPSGRPRYARVDKSDCPDPRNIQDRCGKATITSNSINPELQYILTVCESLQFEDVCDIAPGGDDTEQPGQTGRVIDPSNNTQYLVDFTNEYP